MGWADRWQSVFSSIFFCIALICSYHHERRGFVDAGSPFVFSKKFQTLLYIDLIVFLVVTQKLAHNDTNYSIFNNFTHVLYPESAYYYFRSANARLICFAKAHIDLRPLKPNAWEAYSAMSSSPVPPPLSNTSLARITTLLASLMVAVSAGTKYVSRNPVFQT